MKKILSSFMLLMAAIAMLSAKSPIISDFGKYASYSDRDAWKSVSVTDAEAYSLVAGKALGREWEPVMFSDWKKYSQTGDEACMKARTENNACLEAMVITELLEGGGKYIMQIMDYAWLQSTCPWLTEEDKIMEKAVVHYFKAEFDKLDPSICRTILKAAER